MTDVRRRKLKDDVAATPINIRSRGLKPPRRLKKTFILLIIAALCVTYFLDPEEFRKWKREYEEKRERRSLFAGQTSWLDRLAKSLGYQSEYHHAVIIDAGSSGSRVLAYKFRMPFHVPLFGQSNVDLEEEYFEQSKPGLSAFADDPVKGADTIVQLIKKAEFLTPEKKRASTPLIVRATAGLRLLPNDKAVQLLVHVSDAVDKLGYDTRAGVEIMDGADEGIFIWYTVNLLHDLMSDETMAALDLGGGSTQITYQLSAADAARVPARDAHAVPAGGGNITVYTHSYLNLGLLAARHGIFNMGTRGNDSREFTSVCVEPIISREKWTYANVEYTISGEFRPTGMKREAAFERCYRLVTKYVLKTLDWEPKQPPRGKVAAMSYFYDVAADAGLIDVMKGGTVSVSAYRKAALHACGASNVEQPWACVDLSYVLALLQEAYKMPGSAPVSLFKKVNGHEVSWALGLAYTSVMNRIAEKAALS